MYNSLTPRKKLEETCLSLNIPFTKVKLEVSTRWGSTLRMIERYIALENAIMQVSLLNKNFGSKDPLKDKFLEDFILSNEENELIESLSFLLKDIDHASEYLGNNKNPCLGEVFIVLKGLLMFFDQII